MAKKDTFTGDGFESFPSLLPDLQRTAEYADRSKYSDERLREIAKGYIQFVEGDVMPRARDTSERIIGRALFELQQRSGEFDGEYLRGLDERCEGNR